MYREGDSKVDINTHFFTILFQRQIAWTPDG